MDKDALVIIRASTEISDDRVVFHTIDSCVEVVAPLALVGDLIRLCDGTNTYAMIIQHLGKRWKKRPVQALLKDLFEKGVLFDARELDGEVWKVIENPMRFPRHTSAQEVASLVEKAQHRHRSSKVVCSYTPTRHTIGDILKQRRSARSFSGESIAFQSLINMLWGAYGELTNEQHGTTHRTVPSAGALYPLILHLALFERTGDVNSGVYRVYFDEHGGVGLHLISSDVHSVSRSFIDPCTLDGAHGIIIVCGDFSVTGEKYGNRSLLYVPLEAGHVTQNILLEAVDHDVATLEVGGFVDSLLRMAIGVYNTSYRPLTTIVFGKEGGSPSILEENPTLQVDWAVPMSGQYHPPFAIASARVSEKRSWSHGRDKDPKLALVKAISEAREWMSCGCIPTLRSARFDELDSAVDPRSIIKFHPAQYRVTNFPFAPFQERVKYSWTHARNYVTNAKVYVLADHVYFPYFPETPYYCYANSSGCAAHPDEHVAIEKAVLELIERDSFMNVYMGRIARPTVRERSLPNEIRRRISDLRSIGFDVYVKDHSLDLAPVAMVFAQNHDLEFSTCASCASFDPEYAVSHALMEVEASVLSRLQNGRPITTQPNEVWMPLDHGRLYGQKRYYRKADFLVEGGRGVTLQKMGKHVARTWQDLLSRLHEMDLALLTVELHLAAEYGGNGPLKITRAIVPGLVPMTFGYRQEPAGMLRVYEIARKFGGREMSYKALTKFPHPFE